VCVVCEIYAAKCPCVVVKRSQHAQNNVTRKFCEEKIRLADFIEEEGLGRSGWNETTYSGRNGGTRQCKWLSAAGYFYEFLNCLQESLLATVLMNNCLAKSLTVLTPTVLYCLLPPQWEQHYQLRQRVHNFQLPIRSSSLLDRNYFMRMLFKNSGCALSTASILWRFITALDVLYYFLLYGHYLAAFCLLCDIIFNEWMNEGMNEW